MGSMDSLTERLMYLFPKNMSVFLTNDWSVSVWSCKLSPYDVCNVPMCKNITLVPAVRLKICFLGCVWIMIYRCPSHNPRRPSDGSVQ